MILLFFVDLRFLTSGFPNSLRIHNIFREFTINSLSFSRISFDFSMKSLSVSRIHYELPIFFANSLWIHYLFHELWWLRLLREVTFNSFFVSCNEYWSIICFRLHYELTALSRNYYKSTIFRKITMNSLSFLRIYYKFTFACFG